MHSSPFTDALLPYHIILLCTADSLRSKDIFDWVCGSVGWVFFVFFLVCLLSALLRVLVYHTSILVPTTLLPAKNSTNRGVTPMFTVHHILPPKIEVCQFSCNQLIDPNRAKSSIVGPR